MIKYLTLLLAIPLGIILAQTTKDEKQIYKKYFPIILWLLAIAIIILHLLPTPYYLLPAKFTLLFTFITTLVWHKI